MEIDRKIDKFRNRISPVQKVSFFSAVIWGLITHLACFSANFMFYDGVNYSGLSATYSSGRWMLGFFEAVGEKCLGIYQLPFINGFITIFFLAVSSAFITYLLKVRSEFSGMLIGAILVSFPSVASLFAYMYTATSYTFSLLLSVIAVYLVNEKQSLLRIILGACFISMSLGIYQAYFTFAASLASIIIICDGLRQKDTDVKALFKKGLIFILSFLIGLVLYLLITKLTLAATGEQLNTYMGISTMGQFTPKQLANAVSSAYTSQIYCVWLGIISSAFMTKLTKAVMILTAVLFACALYRSRKNIKKCLFLIFLFLLLPLALNSIYLLCAGNQSEVHTLMRYSLSLTYVIPIVFLELAVEDTAANKGAKALSAVSLAVFLLVPLCYTYRDNTAYLNASVTQEQTVQYLNSFITRIRSAEDYDDELPVAYIGEDIVDSTLFFLPTYDKIYTVPLYQPVSELINSYTWKDFCELHLGWSPREIEDTAALARNEEIQAMPCYPDFGSIKVIDGIVVVKIANEEDEEDIEDVKQDIANASLT